MPVDSKHLSYATSMAWWMRCRDANAGSDAIKAKRIEYLPRLSGQTDTEYDGYLKRALFYPATDRTVMGLTGMVTRREPTIISPDAIEPHLDDITLTGVTLPEFSQRMLTELLIVGRGGVLVDLPSKATENARPYWVSWTTEQIINWRTGRGPNGEQRLTLLVLHEKVAADAQVDPFTETLIDQYRMLALVNNTYVVTLWRKAADNNTWISQPPVVPTRRGKPLDFIPFVFAGTRSIEPTIDKPPLLDLVDVNLSHYLSSADLEHGRHYTALPTPWITGFTDPTGTGAAMTIGSANAWTFTSPEAKVGMLEFTGAGLKELVTALDSKERMMAMLGARMLEQQPRVQETASAVILRQSGEQAVLATIAATLSSALSKALTWHTWWSGFELEKLDDQPLVTLNSDFVDATMNAQEVTALMGLWQAGAISYDTFYYNLQRGEWARPSITVEQEKEAIAAGEESLDAALLGDGQPPPKSASETPDADEGKVSAEDLDDRDVIDE